LVAGLRRPEVRLAAIHALGDLGSPGGFESLLAEAASGEEGRALAAREALERLLGPIPGPEAGQPPEGGGAGAGSVDPASARDRLDELSRRLPRQRWLRGQPFPWSGEASEEPMEALWRASFLSPRPEAPWLRREVPDGFFSGLPSAEVVPGE
jgi:hypothetical protein